MRLLKIGVANLNTTVGAVEDNTDGAVECAEVLAADKCAVAVFPELTLCGYSPEDRVFWPSFNQAQWDRLEYFAADTAKLEGLVSIIGLSAEFAGQVYNCAAVVSGGKILGLVPKEKLPTYSVHYEHRTFALGKAGLYGEINGVPFGDLIFEFPFGTLSVDICEDIWSADGPLKRRSYAGAELHVNLSASPFEVGKPQTRREMLPTRSADNQTTIVYANLVGGNDSLVYDGGGFIVQNGRIVAEGPRWEEGVWDRVVDLDHTSRKRREATTWRADREAWLTQGELPNVIDCTDCPVYANQEGVAYPVPVSGNFFLPDAVVQPVPKSIRDEYFGDLVSAMVTGLDYYLKTGVFKKIGIALSGGKDSILTLLLAVLFGRRQDWDLGEMIEAHSMPTEFNSEQTKSLSELLCRDLGVRFVETPIQADFEREVASCKNQFGLDELQPITLQNIQARIRGQRMLNWSNETGGFWLQTGNMSERAVGYTTIGGDLMGAYSLISNLPKTVVIALLHWLPDSDHFNSDVSHSIVSLLMMKASAELAEDQNDEDDLMPFAVLDALLYLSVAEKMDTDEMLAVVSEMWTSEDGSQKYREEDLIGWADRFDKLFRASVFKWVIAPQGVHVGPIELDRERALQLPVVENPQWQE